MMGAVMDIFRVVVAMIVVNVLHREGEDGTKVGVGKTSIPRIET